MRSILLVTIIDQFHPRYIIDRSYSRSSSRPGIKHGLERLATDSGARFNRGDVLPISGNRTGHAYASQANSRSMWLYGLYGGE